MHGLAGESEGLKLLTLFAGAGGLDLGLELAGFEAVAVNELEPYACESLRANQLLPKLSPNEFERWFSLQTGQRCYTATDQKKLFALKQRIKPAVGGFPFLKSAIVLDGDIRSMSSQMLMEAAAIRPGELTLIAGGPPCQPFSRAGKRQSMEVETGQLFREFVRAVSDLRPRWFLFENVKGLVLTKTDVVSAKCNDCKFTGTVAFDNRLAFLAGKSFSIRCESCQSSNLGLMTERKGGGSLDIILKEFELLGYRCSHAVLNAADYGAPQMRDRLIIIGSRDNESFQWPVPTHSNKAHGTNLELFPDSNMRRWVSMRQALWSEGHPTYGPLNDRAVLWVKNVVRPHDEPVTWNLDRPSPTIGAHQAAKLAIAPFGVPPEQLARQQWHVLGRRQSDLPHVDVDHEYLSDLDILTLQTFPASWYLHGTRMQRASQVGNAVPVTLARLLGETILRACSEIAVPKGLSEIDTAARGVSYIDYAASVL